MEKPNFVNLLMIYSNSGTPIYSRCWGEFCYGIYKKNTVLSGFLSAISNLPALLDQDDELASIEFLKSKFYFTSVNNEITIMLSVKSQQLSESVIKKVKLILNIIGGFIGTYISIPELHGPGSKEAVKLQHAIEHELLDKVISFEFSENEKDHESHCPLCMHRLSTSYNQAEKKELTKYFFDQMKE